MFIDETNILVNGGTGGAGCLAYRREKFVPMGGPFGGDGGKGGSVIFEGDSGLKTLIDLKYQKHITGKNGDNGLGKNKDGSNGEDIIVRVPIGTTVKDNDTGLILADITKNGDKVVIAKGGRGGRGNVSLSTKANPCPSYSEKGEPGEVRNINVNLRMIADVGLVGMPSVGKSTILSNVSAANPKIASYHFTTLSPNLGVVTTKDRKNFILADLPGLIEGASTGAGLGIRFLKHVERTKIIAHVIDMSGSEERDPYEDYTIINSELKDYSEKLMEKPTIIIANKMDLPNAKENLENFRNKIDKSIKIFETSAQLQTGLNEVIDYLGELVETIIDEPLISEEKFESHVLYKFQKEKPWTITKDKDVWVVRGDEVEKLLRMSNFNTEEAYVRFAKKIRSMGIDNELERLGVKEGDFVRILDYEFEWSK